MVKRIEPYIERVDDLPVLFGLLQQMSIQAILDEIIVPHGNWTGLTPGWVITMWLMHILSEQNHCMEPVQQWAEEHLVTLRRLSGQKVTALDFSDDRLALCLQALSKPAVWPAVEARLGSGCTAYSREWCAWMPRWGQSDTIRSNTPCLRWAKPRTGRMRRNTR